MADAIPTVLKIGTTDITSYLMEYEVSYEQMFAEANRNMEGALRATFVGTVPKLTLKFKHLTKAEMKTILVLTNEATMSITWWDEEGDQLEVGNFYRGELKPALKNSTNGLYKEMGVNLIAYDPM